MNKTKIKQNNANEIIVESWQCDGETEAPPQDPCAIALAQPRGAPNAARDLGMAELETSGPFVEQDHGGKAVHDAKSS